MNTNAVSKKLGVSASTVQRWVKHLGLEMKRNEMGHYLYSEEDVALLKEFQEKLQKGASIQEIEVKKPPRRGSLKLQKENTDSRLEERVTELEKSLHRKADSVVSYQLLQHRNELEELKSQVESLQEQVNVLVEGSMKKNDKVNQTGENETAATKPKKKTVLRSFFGF